MWWWVSLAAAAAAWPRSPLARPCLSTKADTPTQSLATTRRKQQQQPAAPSGSALEDDLGDVASEPVRFARVVFAFYVINPPSFVATTSTP